ncbi:MAG: hypothetical protein ACXVOH_00560 [Bacteroidia bacterium]
MIFNSSFNKCVPKLTLGKNLLNIALACMLITLFLGSCGSKKTAKNPDFVSLDGKTFKLKGKDFYPMILNYSIDLLIRNNNFWVSPSNTGFKEAVINPPAKETDMKRLKADFQMIKDMGFNTVRLVNITEYEIKNNALTKYADCGGKDTVVVLEGVIRDRYFDILGEIFKTLNEVGLKAIMLTKKMPDVNPLVDDHLKRMLTRFKDESAILAWDFFNEPLYFDPPERKKEDVYAIVKGWKQFSSMYAPNQLLTLGLTGTREVFEWDPNILDVDFLSIHPYEFHKGEVENEIYWYNKYVNKTWVIGETGYSADNDSISYDAQKMYAEKFLKRAINCGASGFSWWQYKDVQWYEFQSNYLGLVNSIGTTPTSNKDLVINGTLKPAAAVFKNFDTKTKTEPCSCRDNYYNYDGLNQYAVKGKIINGETGRPVVGGGAVAWDQYFGKSNITFSKEDGTFVIFGNYKLYHSIVSATMMNTLRQEFDWDKMPVNMENGIPTYDLGTIKLTPLKLPK